MASRLGRIALGAAVAAVTLAGGPPAGAQPAGDSVTGRVESLQPFGGPFVIPFDAHSGPTGESPSGTVGGSPVTCLNVRGKQGTVGVATTFGGVVFVVEDNDGPGADRLAFFVLSAAPLTCPDPATLASQAAPILGGDLVVSDAPSKDQCKNGGTRRLLAAALTVLTGFTLPVRSHRCRRSGRIATITSCCPTSKDQCKNGGWRNFGVFKNQGDCVSFVATKGKNPPAGH